VIIFVPTPIGLNHVAQNKARKAPNFARALLKGHNRIIERDSALEEL
jgi:hypothetical protein